MKTIDARLSQYTTQLLQILSESSSKDCKFTPYLMSLRPRAGGVCYSVNSPYYNATTKDIFSQFDAVRCKLRLDVISEHSGTNSHLAELPVSLSIIDAMKTMAFETSGKVLDPYLNTIWLMRPNLITSLEESLTIGDPAGKTPETQLFDLEITELDPSPVSLKSTIAECSKFALCKRTAEAFGRKFHHESLVRRHAN